MSVLLLAAFSSRAGATIIGADDRETLASRTDRTARALGLVVTKIQCTGVLVGRRLVLTAAHCLALTDGHLETSVPTRFLPNVVDGKVVTPDVPYGIDVKTGNWIAGQSPRSEDWAVLVLSHAPVDETGAYYEPIVVSASDVAIGSLVTLPGYSSDRLNGRTASVHRNCKVTHLYASQTLLHDCDASAGASGSPLLAAGAIAGLFNAQASNQDRVSEYRHVWANMGASNAVFRAAVEDLRKQYPD